MRSIPKEGSPQSERDLSSEILKVAEGGKLNSHKPDGSMVVLNEIVVDRGPNPTMSSMELYGDDMLLSSIAADGICIATPTGSTAYNLAAGGSLCHPELPGMLVLTPLFSSNPQYQTSSANSLVNTGNSNMRPHIDIPAIDSSR
jgi:NAD+ kinase